MSKINLLRLLLALFTLLPCLGLAAQHRPSIKSFYGVTFGPPSQSKDRLAQKPKKTRVADALVYPIIADPQKEDALFEFQDSIKTKVALIRKISPSQWGLCLIYLSFKPLQPPEYDEFQQALINAIEEAYDTQPQFKDSDAPYVAFFLNNARIELSYIYEKDKEDGTTWIRPILYCYKYNLIGKQLVEEFGISPEKDFLLSSDGYRKKIDALYTATDRLRTFLGIPFGHIDSVTLPYEATSRTSYSFTPKQTFMGLDTYTFYTDPDNQMIYCISASKVVQDFRAGERLRNDVPTIRDLLFNKYTSPKQYQVPTNRYDYIKYLFDYGTVSIELHYYLDDGFCWKLELKAFNKKLYSNMRKAKLSRESNAL